MDKIIFSGSNTIIIQSIFGNLIFEVIIFFIIGIFLFFYFSGSKKEEKILKEQIITKNSFLNFTKIFKFFSYYIGFILFYLSMYLITKSFSIFSFSFFILIINIIIFSVFFISKLSSISKDFLRINSIIFSIFYIINYIYIIIIDNNYYNLIDFINSFLILLIFPILLYHDKKIAKKDYFDYSTLVNFSIYIFVVFLFYFYFYLFHQNLIFWISFISTLFGMIWFEILPKINFLKNDKIVLKYIGIILTYVGIIFGIIYLSFKFSYIILFILTIQTFYNLYIHKKYTNYVSLFLGVFLFFFLIYYIIIHFNIIDYKSIQFLIFSLILSFSGIIFTYIVKIKRMLDCYIIHLFSHIFNIIGIVLFFIFNRFEILNIGILLLLESVYFFISYYKLNPKKEAITHNKH
ncbi:MAG: hypothetical protein PHE25_00110 [Candidatus Gracilibacteria bacterium]|nr:hypothetical protein [Candidatus Gracilibacteria bacterium]